MALRLLMVLAIACALPACQGGPEPGPAGEAEAPSAPADEEAGGLIDTAAEEERVREEYADLMVGHHLKAARRLRDQGDLEDALAEVDKALALRTGSEEARGLRAEILRLLGDRQGETATFLDDEYAAAHVKREEQKVNVQRHLAQAREQLAGNEHEEARRNLEGALFIVESASLSPLGLDDELASLRAEAESLRRALERETAAAADERRRLETEAVLREVAEIEEQQLLEAQQRRARLLSGAIDAFNREDFARAESLAAEVLAEEPDNTVAHDVLENARRARHSFTGARYLAELKENFRRWQMDIERTKVPQAEILRWPSQSFWDRISKLRARRVVTSGGGRTFSPEERALFNQLQTTTVDVPFEETPFLEAVAYLAASSGLNLMVDPRARDDLETTTLTVVADRVSVSDALDLILLQTSADGGLVYEVVGNVVRIIKREHSRRNLVLHVHAVADLTLGLTDFIPPQITLVGVDEYLETPLFGGQAEEAPQPYGTIEELAELVRAAVSPQTWEEGGTINPHGKSLVIHAPPAVQQEIAAFLDDLREFTQVIVTVEGQILRFTDAFLRDVGVDFRGLGGANAGPLAVLDDVTSGLINNASAARDNSGPGVESGGAALPPSSGFFFSDGADGDFRGRTENVLTSPLGGFLTALGGGTFQTTYIDDFAVSAIVRATEKNASIRRMRAPTVTVYNTQRAYLSSINQVSFIQDFDVEVAQTAFIADPVIGVIQEGILLDVRPIVSTDRQFVTLHIGTATMELSRPIETFSTSLGQAVALEPAQGTPLLISGAVPVSVQLPELERETTDSTARIPSGGSVLLSGLKTIRISNQRSGTPILSQIPVLGFLFKRDAKSEDVLHRMAIITATVTDLHAAAPPVSAGG